MSTNRVFSVAQKTAVVMDPESGQVMWSGRPLGREVVDLIPLEGLNRAVVLLESWGSPPDDRANLVSIDQLGRLLWRARLPTDSSSDFFTSVEVIGDAITASSWSCHRLQIDPNTGIILSDVFTK